jgi:hypothetical protein
MEVMPSALDCFVASSRSESALLPSPRAETRSASELALLIADCDTARVFTVICDLMLAQAFISSHVEAVTQTKPALSATPDGTTKLCVFVKESPRSRTELL